MKDYRKNAITIGLSGNQESAGAHNIVAGATRPDTVLGELVRNAIEAPRRGDVTNIIIGAVDWEGVPKLCVADDAAGIDPRSLQRITANLFETGVKGGSVWTNQGLGGRAAALKASPYGVVYQTCYKGKAQQVVFWQEESQVKASGPVALPMRDWLAGRNEKLEGIDGTRVILLGHNADTNTVRHPWDGCPDYGAPDAVSMRFWELPETVAVWVEKAVNNWQRENSAGTSRLVPGREWLDVAARHGEDNTVTSKEETGSGTLWYQGYPEVIKRKEKVELARRLQRRQSPAFGAVVIGNTIPGVGRVSECLYFRRSHEWNRDIGEIGYLGGGRVLTLVVELPDDALAANNWRMSIDRSMLVDSKGHEVRLRRFAETLFNNAPDWVTPLINEARSRAMRVSRGDNEADVAKVINQVCRGFAAVREHANGTEPFSVEDNVLPLPPGGRGREPNPNPNPDEPRDRPQGGSVGGERRGRPVKARVNVEVLWVFNPAERDERLSATDLVFSFPASRRIPVEARVNPDGPVVKMIIAATRKELLRGKRRVGDEMAATWAQQGVEQVLADTIKVGGALIADHVVREELDGEELEALESGPAVSAILVPMLLPENIKRCAKAAEDIGNRGEALSA